MKKIVLLALTALMMVGCEKPKVQKQVDNTTWVILCNTDSIIIEAEYYKINPDNLNAYFYDSKNNDVACIRNYKYIIKQNK